MPVASPERIRGDLVRLAHRGLGTTEFSRRAARILARAVPFDGVCVLMMDPHTHVPTGEVVENGLPASTMARMTEIELRGDDVNTFAVLARTAHRAASLSAATGGKLDRSQRHRELRGPNGFGDEMRAALVDDRGAWGGLTLLRARGRPDFTPADTALVASVAGHLAQGLRRAHLLAEGLSSEGLPDRAVGLVMLAADDTMTAADKGGERALAELRETSRPGPLPLAVAAVAGRARAIAAGRADGIARSRVRTRSGSWLVLHACTLGCDPRAETAVIIEPARGRELAPLIADAHGLTARERAVTQLVAEGLATEAIGERLHLSPWTVQDHLKAVFEKVGVGTRGELVARLFFDHDPPRLAGVTRPERVRRRA